MITFKAIIITSNRRKDGTYPVKIRVTFKGKSRRLPTTLVCTPSDLTRSLHIKSADILNKSDELIARMRNAIKDISPFDLDAHDVDWVVAHIKSTLSGNDFRLDFFEWADRFLLTKTPQNRAGYNSAVNALSRFLGCRTLDINSISRSMLLEFKEHIDAEPKFVYQHSANIGTPTDKSKSQGASTKYISYLAHIYNAAKDRYNDEDSGNVVIPKSPFNNLALSKIMPKGQRNLGRDVMQLIISAETDDPKIRTALDLFIVSFGLMGANMADLFPAGQVGATWVYNRSKTRDRRTDGAEMRVDVPDEIVPFLERLKGKKHWLCIAEQYASAGKATMAINRALDRWCRSVEIEPFTFYAARHTWASLGRSIGIEKATIDDCLVHKGDYSVTDIYAERSWELMQEANRKVLDLFKW